MSKKPSVPSSQPPSSPEKKKQQPPKESASQRADKEARKGEPLKVDSPKDRSPKQENL